MKLHITDLFVFSFLVSLIISNVNAQNSVIRNQCSVDPITRVFEGSAYLFPSNDVDGSTGNGCGGWFCMEDYHIFSFVKYLEFIDHGIFVSKNKLNWVDSNSHSMWAQDIIRKNGRCYFYFPAWPIDTTKEKKYLIAFTVSIRPYGPFITLKDPIYGFNGIAPKNLIDSSDQSYLNWSIRNIFVTKLIDNNPIKIACNRFINYPMN